MRGHRQAYFKIMAPMIVMVIIVMVRFHLLRKTLLNHLTEHTYLSHF